MSLLEITNLSLSIAGTSILKDVSLSVNTGEIVAVTGESGSGKSLTALATMGLLPKGSETTGKIILTGQDLLTTSEPNLCKIRGNDIGMVFQSPLLLKWRRILDNVLLPAELLGLPMAAARERGRDPENGAARRGQGGASVRVRRALRQ